MLARYVQITPDGKVSKSSPSALKFAYGSMLNLRVMLAFGAGLATAQMTTIATRHAVVRRQFRESEKGPEV